MKFEIISKPVWSEPRIIIYTKPGLGKSTLASKIPNSIMLQVEDGSDQFTNDRLPKPKDFDEFKKQLEYCRELPHRFVILDTYTAAVNLAEQKILKEKNKRSLKELGWQTGEKLQRDYMKEIEGVLDELRKVGKAIILLCHAKQSTINDPQLSEVYKKWDLELPKFVYADVAFWADQIIFGKDDVTLHTPEGSNKTNAVGGERVAFSGDHPGYFTKNRFNFKDEIEFSWAAIASEIKKHKARIEGETK